MQPVLTNGPVRLVPFGDRHLTDTYVGWLNTPELVRFSEQRHRSHDLDSCRAYVASFATGPNLLWAVEDHATGSHVGNITATVNPPNGLADISILIGGGSGQGYGFAAWSAVLDYLGSRPDLRKITGGCLAGNAAMVAIMRKAKMQPDGVRKDHFLVDGAPMDVLHFARYT
ncbi:GNAT family N-acetyltransferase [Rhodobacteraceae bacterium N5(2021)]|uniref:GNAT family N-acetyltransferase n=1 Tax=Gymnodinialimonas phycosphaerae TaxID=2841589 RepID=A0A975TRX6_9RHOB|nr:GNAT family N-acetyltransferase [Gymnodinialimonas phycosphaerae]MBY4893450.1 GNAT family N-acetyltransferase [Gymnodinialimonas phycosphaerae]